jgi:hypothetical protein
MEDVPSKILWFLAISMGVPSSETIFYFKKSEKGFRNKPKKPSVFY